MWEIENLKIYVYITLALSNPEVPILVGHGETVLYGSSLTTTIHGLNIKMVKFEIKRQTYHKYFQCCIVCHIRGTFFFINVQI